MISFRLLTHLTQNSNSGLPAPAASLMKERDQVPRHELSLSSVCGFCRYLSRAQCAQQERISGNRSWNTASLCLRGCADHDPGAPFQVFSRQLNVCVCRTGLEEQIRIFLCVCVSVHFHVFLLFMHFFMALLTFISPDTYICFKLL